MSTSNGVRESYLGLNIDSSILTGYTKIRLATKNLERLIIDSTGKIFAPYLPSDVGAKRVMYDAAKGFVLSDSTTGGGSSGITVGTTTITSGTNTRVLYNNSGVVGEYPITGTGNVALSASPTFTGTLNAANITASGVITTTSMGTATPSLDITNTVNGVAGFKITNSSTGTAAQIQNQLQNDAIKPSISLPPTL